MPLDLTRDVLGAGKGLVAYGIDEMEQGSFDLGSLAMTEQYYACYKSQ